MARLIGVVAFCLLALHPRSRRTTRPSLFDSSCPSRRAAAPTSYKSLPYDAARAFAPIIVRLNAEIDRALDDPSLRERLTVQGLEVAGGSVQQFAEFFRRGTERWRGPVAAFGATLDQAEGTQVGMQRFAMKWTAGLVPVLVFVLATGAAFAQSYPAKPVKIIVPFPPGQGTDVATRHLAERLSKTLNRNFFVENRPGAGSTIGIEALAKSPPDGYTIGVGTSGTHTMNPYLYPSVGYDPEKDFEPITLTGMLPLLFAAHPAFGAGNIQELIAAARAKPDSINVALPAPPQRIAFELLRQQGNAPLFGVNYKGSAAALPEVLSGQVPVIVDSITALRAQVTSGKLKALGVTSLKSTELMPGVKSVAEQGLAGFELTAWNAFFAPKGTPAEVVSLLNAEVHKILAEPETRTRLVSLGFDVSGTTPQELAEMVRTGREKWSRIIRAAKISAE